LVPRREAQDLARLVMQLVAPARQVQDRCGRHRHGGVVDLDVDALDRRRQAPLEVDSRGDRVVVIFELGEELAEAAIDACRVADLDGTPDDVEDADRLGPGPRRLLLCQGECQSGRLACCRGH
jgi:hypothetical protein